MLSRGSIAAVIAMLAAGMLAAGSAPASTRTPIAPCPNATIVAADDASRLLALDAILCLVNRERGLRGLRSVQGSRLLRQSAVAHSNDMTARKYFSHISPRGVTPCQRAARAGYESRGRCTVREAIVWGTNELGTPEELVRGLMTSSEHKRIVLGDRYRGVGIGFVLAAPVDDPGGDAATLTLAFGRRA